MSVHVMNVMNIAMCASNENSFTTCPSLLRMKGDLWLTLLSLHTSACDESHIIRAGARCASVMFQLGAHLPIVVTCCVWHSWRMCKMGELEALVGEQVCHLSLQASF